MNAENNASISASEELSPGSGRAAVILALLFGGTLAVACLILWDSHREKLRMAEVARLEEQARRSIHDATRALGVALPDQALLMAKQADEQIASLKNILPADYFELVTEIQLIRGEAEFSLNPRDNANEAEMHFDSALGLMTSPSGDRWEKGMFGRARSRLEQRKFAEAEMDLTRILENNPNFGAAYYWRAQTRRSMGNDKGANADEVRAKRLDSWPPLRDFVKKRD